MTDPLYSEICKVVPFASAATIDTPSGHYGPVTKSLTKVRLADNVPVESDSVDGPWTEVPRSR